MGKKSEWKEALHKWAKEYEKAQNELREKLGKNKPDYIPCRGIHPEEYELDKLFETKYKEIYEKYH